MSNKIETVSIGDLPIATELDDNDELLLRDASAALPENATARLSIATLRAAMGGGADDWSEHPATQDVDLDGHKITGLGEPTDAADAATKGYVDAVSPTKIERSFAWGRAVAEVTDDGNIELAVYLTGETEPLRRVRVPRGNTGGAISMMNRSGMHVDAWVNLLEVASTTAPGFSYALSGGPSAGSNNRGSVSFSVGRWRFAEQNGSAVYLGSNNYYTLPSGVSSIKHGVHLAKQAYDRRAELEWWAPTWTPVSNVDSVTNVECQYTRTYRASGGSLVTLEGTIEVAPDAAGQCAVQVDLPIARVGSALLAGTAMAMEVTPPGHVVAVASVGSTTLTLGFEAQDAAPYLVGFRAVYRAS